jgi:pimeloyl-ACP methyl ester carboxylesterase
MRIVRLSLPRASLSRVACAATLTAGAFGQTVREESIPPVATDPAITIALSPHRVAFAPDVPHRDLLFIYLHGAGGTAGSGTDVVQTAAERGFHAIGITYYMDVLPPQICPGGDFACYRAVRREILEGIDYTPVITISRPNGVENRLVRLLTHLDGLHPGEGWLQFVAAGAPRWNQIVIYGHSMGGSNAALLAILHELAGVCIVAPATDFASWWSTPATPIERIYGFCHVQDRIAQVSAAWNTIGLGAFGSVQDVASVPTPYNNTHMLSTSVEPAQPGQYHNSPTTDPTTPRNPDGSPAYRPVWQYMILGGAGDLPGDLDGDGDVDIADLTLLLSDFGCTSDCESDLDRDGVTALGDLTILLGNFGAN